jgi:hypothetical protein
MSGHRPWREIKRKKDQRKGEPTQTTEQGLEIPVPKREDVAEALRKTARPAKKPSE